MPIDLIQTTPPPTGKNGRLTELVPDRANQDKTEDEEKERLILELLYRDEAIVLAHAGKDVVFGPPLLYFSDDIPAIRPNTLIQIQGKNGSHKSRLAELFVALLLCKPDCETNFIGFRKAQPIQTYTVLYIDTERNKTQEFPAAVQNIRRWAGFSAKDAIPNFRPISIKGQERKNRLTAVRLIVSKVREEIGNEPLVIVLDVVTDCVKSFNDESESLALYDWLGMLCEDHSVTAFTVLHENPGTEKARGHIGTEGQNKASTVIQIGYEEDKTTRKPTDILRVAFLKLRGAARPSDPVYIRFENGGFVPVDTHTAQSMVAASRKNGEDETLLLTFVQDELGSGTAQTRTAFLKLMADKFGISTKTAENRLEQLTTERTHLYDHEGKQCYLVKGPGPKGNGNVSQYQLVRVYADESKQLSVVEEAAKTDIMQAAHAAGDETAPF